MHWNVAAKTVDFGAKREISGFLRVSRAIGAGSSG
jgi:hypothetical protein